MAPQAIMSIDFDWRVTRWNKAAETLFGWTASEVIGHTIPIVPDFSREDFSKLLSYIDRHGHGHAVECERQRKDGSFVHVLAAVDVDFRAVDVGRRAAAQEIDGVRDFAGAAEPPHRHGAMHEDAP